MEIPLRVSNKMNIASRWFGSIERTLIRVPQELRDKLSLLAGDFISLRTKDAQLISLQIATAYKEDMEISTGHAYVTDEIFKLIGIETETGKHEINQVTGITLGCDPEFFLVNRWNGQIVHTGKFFHKWGDVGNDHEGWLMEIRPLPSTSETVVTNNIYGLLSKAKQAISNSLMLFKDQIMMYAASHYNGMTAGFHLHYGLPQEILGAAPIQDLIAMQIVKALDYYVGIPAIIPEGAEDSKRRTQPFIAYGKPGGYRLDNRTLEYRVPGGSMLRHPVLTRGLLGLGALVVEDMVSRIKEASDNFTNLKTIATNSSVQDLYPHIPQVHDIFYMICSVDLGLARSRIPSILEDIRMMIGYENRKEAVEGLFKAINEGHQFSSDIEENWRIVRHEIQPGHVDIHSTSL